MTHIAGGFYDLFSGVRFGLDGHLSSIQFSKYHKQDML